MACEYFLSLIGKDRNFHPVCRIDLFDGEFGSHDSECSGKGQKKECKFNPQEPPRIGEQTDVSPTRIIGVKK